MASETVQPLAILDSVDDGPAANAEVSFETIYAFLLDNEDIIITINASEEEAVRRGLSVQKYNHTKKMREAGSSVIERMIKFQTVEEVPDVEPKQIKLQIWLEKRSSVHIHRMVVSEKGL